MDGSGKAEAVAGTANTYPCTLSSFEKIELPSTPDFAPYHKEGCEARRTLDGKSQFFYLEHCVAMPSWEQPMLKGKKYMWCPRAEPSKRIPVGWHLSTFPPHGMDGEPLGDIDAASSRVQTNGIDVDSTMCSLLDNKTIEDKMVSDICAESKIPGCKLMAPRIWGVADTMCNKAGAMSKMFCLVAKNKFMEDHTVGQMCRKLEFFGQKVLNISIPDSACTTTLKTLWEKAAQTCPHQSSGKAEAVEGSEKAEAMDGSGKAEAVAGTANTYPCTLSSFEKIELPSTPDFAPYHKVGCEARRTLDGKSQFFYLEHCVAMPSWEQPMLKG